ncbi:hypothetical protein FB45DRAFT_940130, partial [Roridomyces roridus]
MDTPTLSRSQRLAFLAVFFPSLDPARIPRLEELSADVKEVIACADVALDATFRLRQEGSIGLSLWPCVWPWVDFIHIHRKDLDGRIDFLPERDFYVYFTLFAAAYRGHTATYELISATPGFWACLVKFWRFLPQLGSPDQRFVLLGHLTGFLADSGVRSHPERLEEMIDAAGSISRFARLVEYLIPTVVTHDTSDTRSPLNHINDLMLFIDDALQIPEDHTLEELISVPLSPLVVALYTHSNCAEELLAAVLLPCDSQEERAGVVIDQCLILIRRMVMASPPTLWLSKLLARGLLRALILITLRTDARGWKLENHVRFSLDLIIPGGLVYLNTVVAYRDAFKEVQDLLWGDDFKNTVPALYETWQNFLSVAEERCEALAKYQLPSFEAQKACDSQTCGLILESSCLKRCSGCQTFYYCSVECQRNDWELGHACRTHGNLLLSGRAGLNFSERSFLRALIHQKYLKERRSIYAQQIQVLSQYDLAVHSAALFTLFDYCNGAFPGITVYPIVLDDAETQERLDEHLNTDSPEWEDLTERAMLGKGRYQLHGIRIIGRLSMRTWVVPLRTDGDKVLSGVVRLAYKVRRGLVAEADTMGRLIYCWNQQTTWL